MALVVELLPVSFRFDASVVSPPPPVVRIVDRAPVAAFVRRTLSDLADWT
jgi:hypothetical protein